MICDSYGIDIDWYRAHARVRPSLLQQIINFFWPIRAVQLWNCRQRLEAAQRAS